MGSISLGFFDFSRTVRWAMDSIIIWTRNLFKKLQNAIFSRYSKFLPMATGVGLEPSNNFFSEKILARIYRIRGPFVTKIFQLFCDYSNLDQAIFLKFSAFFHQVTLLNLTSKFWPLLNQPASHGPFQPKLWTALATIFVGIFF